MIKDSHLFNNSVLKDEYFNCYSVEIRGIDMARRITRQKFNFLKEELSFHKESGHLTEEQVNQMTDGYEVSSNSLNFMKVILTIGALLVGLGILSFIASNWQVMGRALKLSLIIFSYIGMNILSHKTSGNYPKLSESLLLIGVAIYGSGVFLIGQMFHFGGHFTFDFLLWALGILPTAYLLKDKMIFIISIILSFIYINGHLALATFPIVSILLLGAFYYLNHSRFNDSSSGFFLINLLALNAIAVFIVTTRLIHIEDYFGILFLIIGIGMYYAPIKENRYVLKLQGNLVFGFAGLFLTFRYAWQFLAPDIPSTVSILFTVLYVVFLLYLVRQENLMALIFVCLTIFRYYVDTMYDFMPKSLFFLSSGLILLGFGYYIERRRKQTGGILNG